MILQRGQMTTETENNSEEIDVVPGSALVLALDGFEGPIDLLLSLARDQKVDLHKLAILPLAEQYLVYIAEARRLRLEVAADYLVMAAWLAFLKSRLLLPEPEQTSDEPDPAAMAEALKVPAPAFGGDAEGFAANPGSTPTGLRYFSARYSRAS